jgi:[acyl-carrier-protein] S-malonyltransferase
LTASLALWACLGNPEKAFLAGHSLGELTALAVGGAIDFGTAASLVMERGRFMQEAVPPELGGMVAIIGLEHQDIDEICKSAWEDGKVWPANFNCPGQIVISGEKKGIQRAMLLAKEKGARHTIMLPVSIPSHCPLMETAAQRMSEWLNQIDLNHSEVPIVSNCWAVPIKEKNSLKKNIIEQLISPVRWEEGIQCMLQEGVTRFVEVGPGKVLTGLIRRIDKQSELINIFNVEGLERFKETLQ